MAGQEEDKARTVRTNSGAPSAEQRPVDPAPRGAAIEYAQVKAGRAPFTAATQHEDCLARSLLLLRRQARGVETRRAGADANAAGVSFTASAGAAHRC
jgi:hypothetical protein